MKKITALFLVLVLAASLFTACGKKEEVADSSSEPETTASLFDGENPQYINQFFDPWTSIQPKNDPDRYSDTILNFSREGIPDGAIVFYGSSGFTRWSTKYGNTPVEEAILTESGEQICVNRGFGGSNVHDLCMQYYAVLQNYNFKAIVITTFMNASGYTVLEQMQLLAWLLTQIRNDHPDAHIYITDFRPTAKDMSASAIKTRYEYNDRLAKYCANFDNITIIELSKAPMFYNDPADAGTYKNINKDIFVEDQVHYTKEGYDMVTEVFKEALAEELK